MLKYSTYFRLDKKGFPSVLILRVLGSERIGHLGWVKARLLIPNHFAKGKSLKNPTMEGSKSLVLKGYYLKIFSL